MWVSGLRFREKDLWLWNSDFSVVVVDLGWEVVLGIEGLGIIV